MGTTDNKDKGRADGFWGTGHDPPKTGWESWDYNRAYEEGQKERQEWNNRFWPKSGFEAASISNEHDGLDISHNAAHRHESLGEKIASAWPLLPWFFGLGLLILLSRGGPQVFFIVLFLLYFVGCIFALITD